MFHLHIPKSGKEFPGTKGIKLQTYFQIKNYKENHFVLICIQGDKHSIGKDNQIKEVNEKPKNKKKKFRNNKSASDALHVSIQRCCYFHLVLLILLLLLLFVVIVVVVCYYLLLFSVVWYCLLLFAQSVIINNYPHKGR